MFIVTTERSQLNFCPILLSSVDTWVRMISIRITQKLKRADGRNFPVAGFTKFVIFFEIFFYQWSLLYYSVKMLGFADRSIRKNNKSRPNNFHLKSNCSYWFWFFKYRLYPTFALNDIILLGTELYVYTFWIQIR